MRKYLLLLILLLPFASIAAINPPYVEDWEGSSALVWTPMLGNYNVTTEAPCSGVNSIRTRLQGNTNLGTSILRSPSIGTTDGGLLTFSFEYKWLLNNGNISGNPVGAPANRLQLDWQWSNSPSGPWYTFTSIDQSNHIVSSTCETITTTFSAYPGALYLRIVASNTNATGDNYLYIDNIEVSEGPLPTCNMPTNFRVGSKTNTSFTFYWEPPFGTTATSYDWEVRRTGDPGSPGATDSGVGVTGLTATTTVPLLADTTYKIYVRANCSGTDQSSWIGIDDVTFCTPPLFSPTKQTINVCGIQDVELTTNCGGTSYWFDEDNNLVESGVNVDYLLENVSKDMRFFVYCGSDVSANNPSEINVGAGVATSDASVVFSNTNASKVQYIYLASELKAAGFNKGIIRSFGFRTSITSGTLQRDNFSIHMGLTRHEEFGTTNFIPTSHLKEVKYPGDQTLVTNSVNKFQLDEIFMWDGVSNIVVQMTYSDLAATSVSATPVISTSLQSDGVYRAMYTRHSTNDLNAMYNVGNGTREYIRVNGYFDILDGCFEEMKEIEVLYTPAPPLTLTTNTINNCVGSPLTQLYILTGANEYDTYEWFPEDPNDPNNPNNASNAIVGSAATGWTFNPTTDMTYTLKASSSTGARCVITQHVNVTFNPAPQLSQMPNNFDLCAGVIQELKIANFVDETPFTYLFNGNLNGVTFNSSVTGDAMTNDTVYFSEGTGSLKVAYGAQSGASVTFDAALNMTNLHSVEVEFDHIAAFQATSSSVMDYGFIEYSTNNGATWNSFTPDDYVGTADSTLPQPVGNSGLTAMFFTSTSYADWSGIDQTTIPAATPWKSEKFIVPADEFNGAGTLKIRFKVGADGNTQFPGWLIDNVKISPISDYQILWSPLANLYYDQNATVPYDGTRSVGTVYFKGTSNSLNVPYKAEIETQAGCTAEKLFTVSVGLKESPVPHDIDSCGPVDLTQVNFIKNPNGQLYFYNSASANTPITQVLNSGVYYVEQVISKCKSDRVPFTVVINQPAIVPVAAPNQSFCGAATVNDIVFNAVQGLQIKWYLNATGGTALPPSVPINNGTYYGEFTNGVCTSDNRVAVNVTVGIVPATITLSNIYICGSSTIADVNVNAAPNATVLWYQNIGDNTPLPSTTVLSSGIYYVAQKVGACESAKTAVNVDVIQNLPIPSATTVQSFCGSATVGNLTASTTSPGATINWYSYSTSDTPLDATTPLTSGTYYVGQSVGDCDSPKRPVSIRILSTTAPVINPIAICGDATVASLPLSTSSNVTYKVYDTMWATTEMAQNTVITTGVYYISKIEDGCETLRTAVQVTVYQRPTPPTGNANQTFVDYAEVRELKANEANVVWFESYNDAINNVNPLSPSHQLVNDRTYYGVIVGPGQCASLPLEVKVKIVLGLNDLDLTSLKYYPNPVDSELTVSYKDPIKSLEIFDINGRLIKTQVFDSNDVSIDMSSISSGTYMIKVHTNLGSQFIKIIKK